LGWVPSKNHHPDLKSTSPKFFVAQFFTGAEPNWAMRTGIKKPYSALLGIRAGLSSWAADLLLVELKNLYVLFQTTCWRLKQKSTEFISA